MGPHPSDTPLADTHLLMELLMPDVLQMLWPTTLTEPLPADETEKQKCPQHIFRSGMEERARKSGIRTPLGTLVMVVGGWGVGLRTKAVVTQVVMD